MNPDFYNNTKEGFRYPEIAICMEDTDGPMAKMYIPVATPTLSKNIAYDTDIKNKTVNKSNILSDTSSLLITPCVESNYINMRLPDDLPAKKDDIFIVVFIGGELDKPQLIGRC